MTHAPRHQDPREHTSALRNVARPRRRKLGALAAAATTGGLAAAIIAGGSSPASAQRPGAKRAGQANLASYQQFAQCMQTHGFPQWPDANPANSSVFAVAPQAAVGSKQRLGQTARECTTSNGNGDVTLVP